MSDLLHRFVVFDDSMPPSVPLFLQVDIRFAWLGIDHVIGDAFSHNNHNTGCIWKKCYFVIEACHVDIGCVCEFFQLLWDHFQCSQVLIRHFVPTPRFYRCLLWSIEKEGVCASSLRIISGSRMPDMIVWSGDRLCRPCTDRRCWRSLSAQCNTRQTFRPLLVSVLPTLLCQE